MKHLNLRRIWAVIVMVIMVLQLLPMAAIAETVEEETAAVEPVAEAVEPAEEEPAEQSEGPEQAAEPGEEPEEIFSESCPPLLARAAEELEEYFSGKRKFFDLPLNPRGTAFQRKVWTELGRIPYGQVATYGEIAMRAGSPKGFRAVGQANHRNPLPILIPCHRVVAAHGRLGGYGGGPELKIQLLQLEGISGFRF